MSQKLIALVGRPNVGKSTLFNRLSISKKAIVHDKPGVTRDRKYSKAQIGPLEFMIVDTPGLEESEEGKLEYRMMQQTIIAIEEADIVCLIVDNIEGITPADKFFATLIRKHAEKYLLIANKCEKRFIHDAEYYKLGFGHPIPISAEHNQGMMDLYEGITESLGPDYENNSISDPYNSGNLQIVISGRPNAGKSTFINALIGEDRMLTGPEAGITRESVEIEFEYQNNKIKIIDTAGLRKKSNIKASLEKMSASDATHSIRFANVVVLMLDATIALENQDLTIANYVIEEGRGLVIAVNKWDLIEDKDSFSKEFHHQLEHLMSQIQGVPVVFLSAINNQKIEKVLDEALAMFKLWNTKISTSKLNDWLKFATEKHSLPLIKKLGRRVKIKYITQIKTRPPTLKLFTNDPDSITDAYKKYLLNSLRHDFNMPGVPIRMFFAKSDNPYKNK